MIRYSLCLLIALLTSAVGATEKLMTCESATATHKVTIMGTVDTEFRFIGALAIIMDGKDSKERLWDSIDGSELSFEWSFSWLHSIGGRGWSITWKKEDPSQAWGDIETKRISFHQEPYGIKCTFEQPDAKTLRSYRMCLKHFDNCLIYLQTHLTPPGPEDENELLWGPDLKKGK